MTSLTRPVAGSASWAAPGERRALATDQVAMVALFDSIAPLGYLAFGDALQVEILAIAGKLLLLARAGGAMRYSRIDVQFVTVVLLCGMVGAATDAVNGTFSLEAAARYAAFALSISLTLVLVSFEGFERYCRWLVVVPLCGAALQLAMGASGLLQFAYGRFFYLGNSHPNLGGEIAATAAIAAAIGLRGLAFGLATTVLLASAVSMQSRSAVLVIAGTLAVVILRWLARGGVGRIALVTGLAALAALLFQAQLVQGLDYLLNGVLLADDPVRGFDSGLTGRMERWTQALQAFVHSPLVGNGIGPYAMGLAPSPHDAFLFGLAEHGMLSLLLWLPLGYCLWRTALARPYAAAILLAGGVLLVANDRFINLNLYPFAYYAMILRAPRAAGPAAIRPGDHDGAG